MNGNIGTVIKSISFEVSESHNLRAVLKSANILPGDFEASAVLGSVSHIMLRGNPGKYIVQKNRYSNGET
jgi:hypothetical protein